MEIIFELTEKAGVLKLNMWFYSPAMHSLGNSIIVLMSKGFPLCRSFTIGDRMMDNERLIVPAINYTF